MSTDKSEQRSQPSAEEILHTVSRLLERAGAQKPEPAGKPAEEPVESDTRPRRTAARECVDWESGWHTRTIYFTFFVLMCVLAWAIVLQMRFDALVDWTWNLRGDLIRALKLVADLEERLATVVNLPLAGA